MTIATSMKSELEDLVCRYQICWDVFPHEEMWRNERIQTGFDLELYGTHEKHVCQPSPGCTDCLRVYDALEAIALGIIPEEKRSSVYKLSPFDQSIRYSHLRHDRPDVLLTVTIAHRSNDMAPIDTCEVRCLDEMKERLRSIGADHRVWNALRHDRR